jgi:hypothetical protein
MAFDPTTLWDVSNLVSFLSGAGVGAVGTYMADRFTDRRRESEETREANVKFERISKLMPDLITELRMDLAVNKHLVIREFIILSSERIIFNHDKPRIEIYETKHPAAKNQVGLLIGEGCVEVVVNASTPIYKLKESFVKKLERAI